MRKIPLLLILVSITTSAQYKFTSLSTLVNANSVQLELERNEIGFYYKAQAEYNHQEEFLNYGFGFGYSTYINGWQTSLFYLGGKGGLINHLDGSGNNPTAGIDTGVDFKIADGLLLGARYTLDWREDLKFYGVNYEPSLKGGIFFKISLVVK